MSFAAPATSPARRLSVVAVVAISLALALLLTLIASASSSGARLTHARAARIQFLTDGATSSGADTMDNVVDEIGARSYWSAGYNGSGVDVALIDTGVAPVAALDGSDQVIYGPDVSSESGDPALLNLDAYGHGTHMAGIIAGRSYGFRGVAPGARIVSLKVADAQGDTDVERIISAIRWVTQNAHQGGLNIRVLNLSFGALPNSSYKKDDLAYAVEQAWKAGIVTVVAAGNGGANSDGLLDPAFDPYIVAVGADNTRGTTDVSDDNVASFSSRGDGWRDPDVVAPGKSIISLRVPGSYIDDQHPEARVDDLYFRGSGTSQAAAVVSGAAALIVSQRPTIRAGQVKALLIQNARPLSNDGYSAQGHGLIDLSAVLDLPTPDFKQTWPNSTGSTGAWWNVPDATGNSWSSAGNSWSGNSWTSSGWTGPGWDDNDVVDGNSWSSVGWLDESWSNPQGRGVCSQWFLDKKRDSNGVSWGRKTKTVHASGRDLREEFGVSWGKRGKEIHANRSQTLDFCEWKHEQWASKKVAPGDTLGDDVDQSIDSSNTFRELGVSWGKRRGATGATTTVVEWRRGWSVL